MFTKSNRSQLLSYLVIGISAFTVEYGVFIGLNHIGVPLLVAQSISFVCGLLISFYGNRTRTFKADEFYALSKKNQFSRYSTLALVNLLISNALLYVLVQTIGVVPLIAKVFVMILIVGWNFIIFKTFVFK